MSPANGLGLDRQKLEQDLPRARTTELHTDAMQVGTNGGMPTTKIRPNLLGRDSIAEQCDDLRFPGADKHVRRESRAPASCVPETREKCPCNAVRATIDVRLFES